MSVATLRVQRIAETTLSLTPHDCSLAIEEWLDPNAGASEPGTLGEFAGRSCYQSWDRPNPNTADTADYLANIIRQRHFSVLAHASVSYYIEGVSRSLTHELVRHRWPAFSQLSQRYVEVTDDLPIVMPPDARGKGELEDLVVHAAQQARRRYLELLQAAERHGLSGKRARQLARAVLPNAAETKIVASGNLRAWRDLLAQRLPEGADEEIRELAHALLVDLSEYAPEVFADIKAEG